VATAAFAKVAYDMKVILVEHTRKFETVADILTALAENKVDGLQVIGNHVNTTSYIIGTFWKNSLDLFKANFTNVYIYTFGETLVPSPTSVIVSQDVAKKGSIYFLTQVLPPSLLITALINSKEQIISKVNVRCFGEGNESVQQFFTGIYDYSASHDGLLSTFMELFMDNGTLYDIMMTSGRTLMENHKGLCNERARKNTKLFTAKCGAKVALTEGPELINFTHEALVKTNVEVDLTVVVRYQFDKGEGPDKLCYSIRSHSEKFNANDVIKGVSGSGGSNKAAGCAVPVIFDTSAVL
jgi:hypothetical protein